MPVLALLSWAAGLGVAEETPLRIPTGEFCTPASTGASRGHVSSLRASFVGDLTAGLRACRWTGTFFSAPRGAALHPASVYTPRLGPGYERTQSAPTHSSFYYTLGAPEPWLALAGVRKLN